MMGASVIDLRLYLVTDREQAGARGVAATVAAALDGGVTVVQLRDKHAGTRELIEQARALRAICARRGVPLIINDRVDVAMVAEADGVHLGQSDMALVDARRLLGPESIVGVSVRTDDEVRAAAREGATYVAANGVWATATKTDFGAPLGLDGLRSMIESSTLPMVAIGGIDTTNAWALAQAGCDGIAVVSAVMKSPDPADACRRLRRAFAGG